jgi:hypothetical protein
MDARGNGLSERVMALMGEGGSELDGSRMPPDYWHIHPQRPPVTA